MDHEILIKAVKTLELHRGNRGKIWWKTFESTHHTLNIEWETLRCIPVSIALVLSWDSVHFGCSWILNFFFDFLLKKLPSTVELLTPSPSLCDSSPLWQHQTDGHHPDDEQRLSADGGQGLGPLPLHQDSRVPALWPEAGVQGRTHQSCGHNHQGTEAQG